MKSKKRMKIKVGTFTFEVSGGRFSVATLKECLYAYMDYLDFCKKSMLYPITPVTFVFVIAASQRKAEYGKRRLIRQLTEKMGLFPFLFWIEIRSYAWRVTNNQLNIAFEKAKKVEAKKVEAKKTSWSLLFPWTWKM